MLAFNHVLIREEVSLMDTCELFDMTVLFFSAPKRHLSFPLELPQPHRNHFGISMTPENEGHVPSLN